MINVESVNGMDIETLKATLLGVLSGDLKVKDGVLVEPTTGGPRGPTAKALLEAGGGAFVYTDILLTARNLIDEGIIQESRKGRKATWTSTSVG